MVSLYEVVGINPARSMTVRDLVRGGGDGHRAREAGLEVGSALGPSGCAHRHGERQDVLHRRRSPISPRVVAPVPLDVQRDGEGVGGGHPRGGPQRMRTVGGYPVHGARDHPRRRTRRSDAHTRLAARHHPAGPGLRRPSCHNTDDEPIISCMVRFPTVGEEAEVATMLDGIECFERDEEDEPVWTWSVPGSPLHRMALRRRGDEAPEPEGVIGNTLLGHAEMETGTLTLFVNSRERAERGIELLTTCLGNRVGPPLISHQEPEKTLDELAGQSDVEPEVPPDEAVQVIHSYLDGYYRRILDDPAPRGGGQDAAASGEDEKRARESDRLAEAVGKHRVSPRSAAGPQALRHELVVARTRDRSAAPRVAGRLRSTRASVRGIGQCRRAASAAVGGSVLGAEPPSGCRTVQARYNLAAVDTTSGRRSRSAPGRAALGT